MKLRKFVLKESMIELFGSDLKKLKGGTDVTVTTCFCHCVNSIGKWYTDVPSGKCEDFDTSKFCEFGGVCYDLKDIFLE